MAFGRVRENLVICARDYIAEKLLGKAIFKIVKNIYVSKPL